MDEEKARDLIREHARHRADVLRDITSETATDGLKYLTLIHLAGMGGTLSFIGATKTANAWMVAAFCSFFIGAFAVGASYLLRYWHFGQLLSAFNNDVTTMYTQPDRMAFSEVSRRDVERSSGGFDSALACALLAFALFACGGILGFYGVYHYAQ